MLSEKTIKRVVELFNKMKIINKKTKNEIEKQKKKMFYFVPVHSNIV